MIRAEQLRAGYGDRTVLKDLSFQVERGQVVAVVGPGCSGKTTLLRALQRGGTASSGFWHRGYLELPRGKPGVLPQKPVWERLRIPPSMSLKTEILQENLHRFWQSTPAAAEALQQYFGPSAETPPLHLLRLAAFTMIAAPGRPFLLLDEPEVDLTAEGRSWITSKIRELRESRAIVAVTHNLQFARETADYCLLLVEGQIVEQGPAPLFFQAPRQVRTREYLRMGS